MIRRVILLAALLCCASAFVVRAAASTIYSTFGSGLSYDTVSEPWFVSNSANPLVGPWWVAVSFTSPGNFQVTQVDAALGEGVNGDAQPQSVGMSLWTNTPGASSPVGQPGVQLGSWVIPNVPNLGSQVFTIAGITGVSMASGQVYWL